jgi:hypothetical protein
VALGRSGITGMDSGIGDALLLLSRKREGWRDSLRSYLVILDGEQVARIRRGQAVELPVSPGRHEILLKVGIGSSPTVEVDAEPGEQIRLFCEPGGSATDGLNNALLQLEAGAWIKLTRL